MPEPEPRPGCLRAASAVLGIWLVASLAGGIAGTCIGFLPETSFFVAWSPIFALLFGIALAPATVPAVAAFWWIHPDFVTNRRRRDAFLAMATAVGWLIGTGYLRIWLASDGDPSGVMAHAAPWGCAVGGLVAASMIHRARRARRPPGSRTP